MSGDNSSGIVRFGIFELDVPARELRRSGLKVKLQEQPFQVLAYLLERPGDVVTREELRTKLWPADTFVDFDHGLNAAIKRLRDALGESAEAPVFIETLARRGYKFIGPLDRAKSPNVLPVVRSPVKSTLRFLLIGAILVVIALSAALSWLLLPKRPPRITSSVRLTFNGGVGSPPAVFGDWFSGITTDGNRIYYSAIKGSTLKLAFSSVIGGDQVLMVSPFTYAPVRHISPDGSALLVYGYVIGELKPHLWLVPTAGGGPRRLGDLGGQDGAWSPDGSQLVYSMGQDLYLSESDGSRSRKLATLTGRVFWIRWAPNAKRMRFTVIDPKTNGHTLWECRADGSNLHRLPLSQNGQAQECCGEWTPDGRFFLFRVFQNSRADIWLVPEKHQLLSLGPLKPIRLTAGPMDSAAAIPSRDGKKLFAVETAPKSEMLRYDLRTRTLAPYLTGMSVSDAALSADRQWIAYVEGRGKETILWRTRVDGSERLQLSLPPMFVMFPHWSPDGKQIVFMGKTPGAPWNNYVTVSSGGGPAHCRRKNATPSMRPGLRTEPPLCSAGLQTTGSNTQRPKPFMF